MHNNAKLQIKKAADINTKWVKNSYYADLLYLFF